MKKNPAYARKNTRKTAVETARKPAKTVRKANPILPTYFLGYKYRNGPTTYLVKHLSDVPVRLRCTATRVAYDQNTNQVVAELKKFS